MDDGRITGTRHDNGTSAGDQFFARQYPLHSGKPFGLGGRLLVLFGGIVTLWLCLSGSGCGGAGDEARQKGSRSPLLCA